MMDRCILVEVTNMDNWDAVKRVVRMLMRMMRKMMKTEKRIMT